MIAVNREGRSNTSNPTQPQLIKAQRAPPKIARKSFEIEDNGFIKCRKNQQFVLDVQVEGTPPPKTSWWLGQNEVKTDEGRQIRVSHSPNMAKLVLGKADQSMSGSYTLKAENQHGKDEATVEIKVAGRPGKPRGPLEVFDVTRKTAMLKWLPPEDDGGAAIAAYEVEKFDPYVEQWVPVGSTKGTSMQVRNLAAGKSARLGSLSRA